MPDTPLSLVTSHSSQLHTGLVTLLERKAALDVAVLLGVSNRNDELADTVR